MHAIKSSVKCSRIKLYLRSRACCIRACLMRIYFYVGTKTANCLCSYHSLALAHMPLSKQELAVEIAGFNGVHIYLLVHSNDVSDLSESDWTHKG